MLLAWGCLVGGSTLAQAPLPARVSYGVRLQFQAYALPFQNLGGGFRNVGGAFDLHYGYNARGTLGQTLTVGYQSHTQHENSLYLNTQVYYRPVLFGVLEPSVALGVGRLLSFSNPRNPFYEREGDHWRRSDRQQQGHWQVPLSLGLGYRLQTAGGHTITPFVDYQITPIVQYNSAFVVLPYTLTSVGARFRFSSVSKTN